MHHTISMARRPGVRLTRLAMLIVKRPAQQTHRHKKKSFMQKMRDKATGQVQKLFSAKHQDSKPD